MIEAGTCDELKESILGNIAWHPDADDLLRTKEAFEREDLKVTHCFIKEGLVTKTSFPNIQKTIKVYFNTKRDVEGALAKARRAIRSLRLAMCQFDEETPRMSHEAVKVYSLEIRGHD